MTDRIPRPLDLPDDLRTVLARLRHLEARKAPLPPAEIDLDQLADVEGQLGMRLPDALLALYAAHLPSLASHHELGLSSLPFHAETAWNEWDLPHHSIAIGGWSDTREASFVAWRRHAGDDTHLHVELWACRDGEPPEHEVVPLIAWLTRHKERLAAELKTAITPDPPRFEPTLVECNRPKIKVKHPRFGEGTLLAERGDKVEVEFPPPHGRKVLVRHVVEVG